MQLTAEFNHSNFNNTELKAKTKNSTMKIISFFLIIFTTFEIFIHLLVLYTRRNILPSKNPLENVQISREIEEKFDFCVLKQEDLSFTQNKIRAKNIFTTICNIIPKNKVVTFCSSFSCNFYQEPKERKTNACEKTLLSRLNFSNVKSDCPIAGDKQRRLENTSICIRNNDNVQVNKRKVKKETQEQIPQKIGKAHNFPQKLQGILLVAAEQNLRGEDGGIERVNDVEILTCPHDYNFNKSILKCEKLITAQPLKRCAKGFRQNDHCVEITQPLSVGCPEGYSLQEHRCVRTETTLKKLTCPPTSKIDGYHCVHTEIKEVKYVCEKGQLNSEGVCELVLYERPKITCPPYFVLRDDECVKINYFPCEGNFKNVKGNAESIFTKDKTSKEDNSTDALRSKNNNMRALDSLNTQNVEVEDYEGKHLQTNVTHAEHGNLKNKQLRKISVKHKHYYNDGFPSSTSSPRSVQTCWDKEVSIPVMECEHDGKLNDGMCTYTRVFPAISKCAGYIKKGECIIEIRNKAKYTCPLDYIEGGIIGDEDTQGLHVELPYISMLNKREPNAHYADAHVYTNKHGFFRRLDADKLDFAKKEREVKSDKKIEERRKRFEGSRKRATETGLKERSVMRTLSKEGELKVMMSKDEEEKEKKRFAKSRILFKGEQQQLIIERRPHSVDVIPSSLISTLPVSSSGDGKSYVIEYTPRVSSSSGKELSKIQQLELDKKKKKQLIMEEILKEKPNKYLSEDSRTYCFREAVTTYSIACPAEYIPNPQIKTCNRKSNLMLVCEKDFTLQEKEALCTKIKSVDPLKVAPSSIITCNVANDCANLQISQYPAYVTDKQEVKLMSALLQKEKPAKKYKHSLLL